MSYILSAVEKKNALVSNIRYIIQVFSNSEIEAEFEDVSLTIDDFSVMLKSFPPAENDYLQDHNEIFYNLAINRLVGEIDIDQVILATKDSIGGFHFLYAVNYMILNGRDSIASKSISDKNASEYSDDELELILTHLATSTPDVCDDRMIATMDCELIKSLPSDVVS